MREWKVSVSRDGFRTTVKDFRGDGTVHQAGQLRRGHPDVAQLPEWLLLNLAPGDTLAVDGHTYFHAQRADTGKN